MKSKHSHNGFTLIEIAAVLVIVAILATLALKHMGGSGIKLYGEADRLVADLRYAQNIAMTRAPNDPDDEDYVKVEITANGWYLPYNEGKNDEEKLWFANGKRDSWTVKDSVTITPNIDITFKYPKGAVELDSDHQEIVLTQGSKTITIRIYEETGYVEIQ